MVKTLPRTTKIKWVGDPRVTLPDGYTCGDWVWENNRVVAVAGKAVRICHKDEFPGLSKTYVFGGTAKGKTSKEMMENSVPSKDVKTFVIDMDPVDADIILERGLWEFVDVTGIEHPEFVVNEPIRIHRERESDQLYRSR
jgi:hypothetical protein